MGLILAAGAAAIAIATRLASGRSFENLGAQLRERLFGDLDEESLASREARSAITGDRDLLLIAGREGSINPQIRDLFQVEREFALKRAKGRTIFELDPAFQSNGALDILVLRGRDAFLRGFNSSGGPSAVQSLRQTLNQGDSG